MVGYHHEAINGRELTTTEHSEAGLASGIATRLIIQPLDVLKIRFQLQEEPIRGKTSGKYKGVLQSTRLILREEGYGALWKGHVPAQGLSAMYGLVQFSSFETLSAAVGNRLPSTSSDFLCGSFAGCIAMTCAMPLDVIRTRLVAQGNQGVVYRGVIVSFHSICFTVSKLVFGIASDRYSPVVLLFTGLTIASITNIFLAFANSYAVVTLSVITIGAVQGLAWIPATRLVATLYQGSSYGTMFSLLGCGATTAGLIITPLSEFYWREIAFYIGLISLGFCFFGYLLLSEENTLPKFRKEGNTTFSQIISSKVIWGIALSYIFTLETRIVAETWLPLYVEEQNLSSSSFLFIYEIAGFAGTILSGMLLDRVSQVMPQDRARKVTAICFSTGMLLAYLFSTSFPKFYLFFGFLCGFFTNASLNIWCMISSDAGEKQLAGSCSALISFIANLGPILAGSPLAHLISLYGYSVFRPFFGLQIVTFLVVISLRIPLRMDGKSKDE